MPRCVGQLKYVKTTREKKFKKTERVAVLIHGPDIDNKIYKIGTGGNEFLRSVALGNQNGSSGTRKLMVLDLLVKEIRPHLEDILET